MKGMVFTEFMDMVDAKFGPELTERILDASRVESGGVYTAVGTYDHGELVDLVVELSKETGIPVPDLVRTYGHHLFGRFVQMYPRLFEAAASTFDFLEQVDGYIHVEVKKLYPDAELPRFTSERLDDRHLRLDYRSARPFGDFAEGLIQGCADHFGERIAIKREPLAAESGVALRFLIALTG